MLFLLLSLLGLPSTYSAATPASLSISNPHSPNSSAAVTEIANNINSSFPQKFIDPRFSYERSFANQYLDIDSAYLNALLALADLSTKGWSESLSYESMYTFSCYGDVTVRIHASQKPSSLQYRHAIWGLYSAIRETWAHDFKATVLTLYWSSAEYVSRHKIGYVTILGAPAPVIQAGNFTERALKHALPRRAESVAPTLANITGATMNNTTSPTIDRSTGIAGLRIEINLESRPLSIDAVFNTLYAGLVQLASFPQNDAITQPGFVKDDRFRTFLRWDWTSSHVRPLFEYRFAIAAVSALPVYMYQHHQFSDARFTVYKDRFEVGRGWLYGTRVGGASDTT